MGRVLVHLPQSPWSEKARWALDHHGVSYRAVEHMPLLYEAPLRVLSRDLGRRITVPILFEGSDVYSDSLDIARRAEEIGTGQPLFPAAHLASILKWNDVAESIMKGARMRVMPRLLASPRALAENVPSALRPAAAALAPVAKLATRFIMAKHGIRDASDAELEAGIVAGLEQAAAALGRREHLVADTFTFADIAVACALGFVSPHDRVPLGAQGKQAFTEPTIAAAFPELVAWRDRTVERHR
jgi:glutathione S-transferase